MEGVGESIAKCVCCIARLVCSHSAARNVNGGAR